MKKPLNLDDLPEVGVAKYVSDLAKAHNVTYHRSGLDVWAEAVSRLSGDDVETDNTSGLIVRLKQECVITTAQFARLITNYFREKRNDG